LGLITPMIRWFRLIEDYELKIGDGWDGDSKSSIRN